MHSDEPSDGPDMSSHGGGEALAGRVGAELVRQFSAPLDPGLYLVATPIGNLADITIRALTTLARADAIYCEDTRHSRILMAHFAISRSLRPYHEHNAEEQRPRILAELSRGQRVALISDAGTPLISDPGYKLVRDAIAQGHTVTALPGASAVLTALSLGGLPTDTFLFAGFLPPRSAARQNRIIELANVPATLVIFEAPSRVAESLADLAAVLGRRPAAVARELTKLHEAVQRGTLDELASALTANPPKGEIVLVIGPPQETAASDDQIIASLNEALKQVSLRDAARIVAERHAVPKSRVYELGLKIKSQGSP